MVMVVDILAKGIYETIKSALSQIIIEQIINIYLFTRACDKVIAIIESLNISD